MSGRPRRGEAASSAGAKAGHIHYSQEASVLRLKAPDVSEDDLPSYELADAIVLDKDGKTIVNALEVLLKGPFIVRGRLVAMSRDEDEAGYWMQKEQCIPPLALLLLFAFTAANANRSDQENISDQWRAHRDSPVQAVLDWRGAVARVRRTSTIPRRRSYMDARTRCVVRAVPVPRIRRDVQIDIPVNPLVLWPLRRIRGNKQRRWQGKTQAGGSAQGLGHGGRSNAGALFQVRHQGWNWHHN